MDSTDFIKTIEKCFACDVRIKRCLRFQADKALQIQLNNGENFNIIVSKLDKNAYIIKRPSLFKEETVEAIEEARQISQDIKSGKRRGYKTVEELKKDLE